MKKIINIHHDGQELEVANNREAKDLRFLQSRKEVLPFEVALKIKGTGRRVYVLLNNLVFSEEEITNYVNDNDLKYGKR